jgi:hypothetical protein
MKAAFLFLVAASILPHVLAEQPLPPDVERVVDQRAAAIAKIDRTYVQELEKLKINYTKQGNLNVANKIANLILESQSDNYVGKWIAGRAVTEIKPDGEATVSNFRGNWIVKESTLIIQWNNGFTDSYELPPVDGVLIGKNQLGKPLRMTRKK